METTAEKERSGGVDLTLSELAATKVREYLAEEELAEDVAGLRVSVVPGGCSGFEYSLTLEDEREEDDFVVETRGITLYVDPFSAQYLSGTSIGFKSSFQGAGFTFQNPNATGGCGCGSSFAV
ncbi:MAG: iron-sulfur cluster insertion protein ErpA [Gemmatimonadota bacterium]